jgi:phosphomannomutase/phosphoglucomutase
MDDLTWPNGAEMDAVTAGASLVNTNGFREYDARWLYPKDINLPGMRAVGLGLGTLLHERGKEAHIVSGYDYRSYSQAVQGALIEGLVEAGCTVHDIGLGVTPMAYFAQFALDVAAVAMVTASHNPNGWTGVKMGFDRPFTLEPAEMAALKQIVLKERGRRRYGGKVIGVSDMRERYVADLTARPKLKRRLKVVVACGNGTASLFAPVVLEAIGCEVVPLHCQLDHSFPNYNPNPEELVMLRDIAKTVMAEGADIGLAFDGDGDRCGIIDNSSRPIFADKIGLMLAQMMSEEQPGARFVVDVKSTALYQTDPVLKRNGATADYWKTGHSYIKRRTAEIGAIAGFEKSGHFFFRAPYGRGYDDGLVSALAVCEMLDRATGRTLAELHDNLPITWNSPTMSPHCSDEEKYKVVDDVRAYFEDIKRQKVPFAGYRIQDLILTNGVRAVFDDGSWCLVRASSNKPELVVVCESMTSQESLKQLFSSVETLLKRFPEVGAYNQKL